MSPLDYINRTLDGLGYIFGGNRALDRDPRVSLENLRCKQAEGLASVTVSLSKIAAPVIEQTRQEVREMKEESRIDISEKERD